jgi:hypothetical protein
MTFHSGDKKFFQEPLAHLRSAEKRLAEAVRQIDAMASAEAWEGRFDVGMLHRISTDVGLSVDEGSCLAEYRNVVLGRLDDVRDGIHTLLTVSDRRNGEPGAPDLEAVGDDW